MLRQITALIALSLALAGCATQRHSEECAVLNGEWVIVAAKENDAAVSPERLKQLASRTHTIGDGRITPCCLCPNCTGSATIEIDSANEKMTIRCAGGGCCADGHIQKGIYLLADDTFIFSRTNEDSFPKDEDSAPNRYTYKRVKPGEPAPVAESPEANETPAPAEKDDTPKPFPMQNPADDTQKSDGCEKGKRYAVPSNAWNSGVLTVFFPEASLGQVDAAVRKAISRAKSDKSESGSVKISTAEGAGIFGHGPDGIPCNCTLSPAENFTIVRIHCGDWGSREESMKIADLIAENL